MVNSEKKMAAAYVSWGTFKNALDQLSQGVPPNRIDRTVFPGMAWAIQNQLFSCLKFLGLINDQNRPTPELEALAGADGENRKAKLREILERCYSELFALDLKKTTPGELLQKMGEAYSVSGDTREKAVRFFTSAAEYAGIELSPLFEAGKKPNGSGAPATPRPKRRGRPPGRKTVEEATDDERTKPGTSKSVELESGGTLTLSASLDLFSLNPKDRKFIFELIDKLEDYERSSVKTETPEAATSGAS
jgi:hypothetical protein